MSIRRTFVLLLSVTGCAFAFAIALPSEAPGLSSIESAAPHYFGELNQRMAASEDDDAIIELRHRARFALAQLQDQDRR